MTTSESFSYSSDSPLSPYAYYPRRPDWSEPHLFSTQHQSSDISVSEFNVLIDSDKKARLSDFGMSTIIVDCEGPNSFFSTTIGGAIRWSDVALYRFEQAPALSIYTDLYSFGSVMLQARINPNIWIQRD